MKTKIYLLIILFFTVINSGFGQYQQSRKMTKKYFPDPDVEFNTPAFDNKYFFTRYKELITFLEDQIKGKSDLVKMEYIGESQKGRQIPILYFGYKNSENKIRVFYQGGLHGNEPGSTEAMLALIDFLLNTDEGLKMLEKVHLAIVPMANIDGYQKQDRYAANNRDLNRDQIKLTEQESRHIKQATSDFSPQVAIDFHEFNPTRADFRSLTRGGVTNYYDAMFLYSGNLNVHPAVRKITEDLFVKNAKEELSKNGLRIHDYFTTVKDKGDLSVNLGGTAARSSATNFALTNCVSILMEIRGSTVGKTSFKRRVNTSFLLAKNYLNTTINNIDEIKNTLSTAIDETKQANAKIIVDSERKEYLRSYTFIDCETLNTVDIELQTNDALQSVPILIRERPFGYILTPECTEAVKKLEILGIKVVKLESEKTIEVESYMVDESTISKTPFEGIFENEVVTTIINKEITFPEGSYIVYLDQKNANLAVNTLEPENPNGFVYFRVIPAYKGKELPIYRYTKKSKL